MHDKLEVNPEQKKLNPPLFEKCLVCSKKLMVNIKCKCENHYCEKHRYSHNCTYSYFLVNKATLEKKNQKIEADKVVRI
jgi:hypothetical protein